MANEKPGDIIKDIREEIALHSERKLFRADKAFSDELNGEKREPTLVYDRDSDTARLEFSIAGIVRSEAGEHGVTLDYDVQGKIAAIRFTDASKLLPDAALPD